MPTLVWMRRPDAEASGTSGAGDNSSATRRAASVFDVSGSVISASAVPDKRHDGGNEKKRKINSADDAAQKEALVRSSSRRPQKKRSRDSPASGASLRGSARRTSRAEVSFLFDVVMVGSSPEAKRLLSMIAIS